MFFSKASSHRSPLNPRGWAVCGGQLGLSSLGGPLLLALGLGAAVPVFGEQTLKEMQAELRSEPIAITQSLDQTLAAQYWVPRTQLTVEQLLEIPDYCSGRYQTPIDLAVPVGGVADAIYAQADSVEMVIDKQADLAGGVRIVQGTRRLLTETASIDLVTRQVQMNQPVEIQDSTVVLSGRSAVADLKTKAATLQDAQYLLLGPAMRGTAGRIEQSPTGDKTMLDGSFTRCEPGNRNWSFSSSSLRVEEGSPFAVAQDAVLRVRDLPVLYLPYLKFPVSDERLSGWLFPAMGYSDEDGFDLAAPYYLNLAPNYDATITPRIMTKRGVGAEVEFRHLSSWSQSSIGGALLPKDDEFNGTYDRDDFDSLFPGERFNPADRWLLNIDHQGTLGQFGTLIDYTAVSDRDYFRDLGSDLSVSSRVELERRAEITYAQGGFEARLWSQRFQRIDEQFSPDPYYRLPELDLAYRADRLSVLGLPVELSIASKFSRFDRNTSRISGTSAVVGRRAHVEPRLQLPLNWSFGFVNLVSGYRLTRYDLDAGDSGLVNYDESRTRRIGFGSLDAGLFFDRNVSWFGRDLVQTLEPRAYYLRQGYEAQSDLPLFDTTPLTFSYSQLYRDNRFAGLDRIGDANQLSTGLTTRFLDRDTGQEYFRASIGEIWYFRNRRVGSGVTVPPGQRQSTSALAAEVAATIGGGWNATANIIWDPHDGEVDESSVALQFRPDARRIVNLGYRNQRLADIDQTDFSFYWPVSSHYGVIGRWNYDLVSGRTIEAFGGVEYNDCCIQLRLLARRFVDSPSAALIDTVEGDNGIFVQVVFKGLAGFGNRVESVLTGGIRGYSTPAYGGLARRKSINEQ